MKNWVFQKNLCPSQWHLACLPPQGNQWCTVPQWIELEFYFGIKLTIHSILPTAEWLGLTAAVGSWLKSLCSAWWKLCSQTTASLNLKGQSVSSSFYTIHFIAYSLYHILYHTFNTLEIQPLSPLSYVTYYITHLALLKFGPCPPRTIMLQSSSHCSHDHHLPNLT